MVTITHIDSNKGSYQDVSASSLIVKLHLQAYRSCSNGIIDLAKKVLTTSAIPLQKGLMQARKLSLIDICYVSALKVANGAYSAIYKVELFPDDSLRTSNQKKHEIEIILLKRIVGKNTIYPQFCKTTAQFIDEFIPKFIAEKCSVLPYVVERWILFQLWYTVRYLNYQLSKRLNYQAQISDSEAGKCFQELFLGFRTHAAHVITGKNSLRALINFEHLLLQVCSKVSQGPKTPNMELVAAIVGSLADSFSQQGDFDQYLKNTFPHSFPLPEGKELFSEETAFIMRLEWHKKNNTLPKGMPDPHKVSLTTQNLKEKLDESLTQYFNELVSILLDRLKIPQFKKSLLGVLYLLEGRDLLIGLFTFLISEYGYKQLADPHLFALAILNNLGIEPMEYELDGFGRKSRKTILTEGQKMMKAALNNAPVADIFKAGQLKQSPGSGEGIFQKMETKALLKSCIASLIYQAIKTDEFQHPESILKKLREKATQLPLIGSATLGLHLLFNGTFFSLGYLFRGKEHTEKSFLDWIGRHLSGKKLYQFLADKIVELIYDPSWPITLLKIIESAVAVLTKNEEAQPADKDLNKKDPTQQPDSDLLKKDLTTITEFLCGHFAKGTKLSLQGKIGQVFDYFAGDAMFDFFMNYLKPSSPSFLEKTLASNIPVIKELLLYTRVIDSFRKEMVGFEGDAKFWECFIRESLNQFVALKIKMDFKEKQRPTTAQATAIREKIIDEFLSLDQDALRSKLAVPFETYLILEDWIEMPREEDDFVCVLPLHKIGIDTTA